MEQDGRVLDVVVVGGGPAGLSGAVALARSRRRVVVVDAGEPRNAPAEGAHNYLSRDGVAPRELLAIGRRELAGYGGEVVDGEVVAARRLDGGGTERFEVVLADGRALRSRALLVTTGVTDELPDVPGLRQRWGRDVLHCPYCHGWEVREQPIAVLATSPLSFHQVLLWRQLSDDVTVVLHGAEPSDEQRERLAARGIAVVEGPATGLRVEGGALTGVELADGHVVPARALAVASRPLVREGFLTGLGLVPAPVEAMGVVIGTALPAGPAGATDVPGLRVAGNVAEPMAQVGSSAAAGTMAGAALNAELAAEDADRAVAARRAGPAVVVPRAEAAGAERVPGR
ncbi:NAD(P)/FAD-dependent oxidoreductase [Kineococcus sp. TRM81007]|uniref:NAD(P)/FAD-dependent oxidoreductase n=1 Tax=Kineococcus sp. TRM81007 TaxID=2925831 RepID=UPI0035A9578A